MANLNKVILIGRLTRDPESRQLGTTTKASFGVAVNNSRKDKTTGQYVEEAIFLDAEAWGKTAEFVMQYLNKGTAVIIDGKLKQDSWDDKATGQKRSKILVSADNISFAESKGKGRPADTDNYSTAGDAAAAPADFDAF